MLRFLNKTIFFIILISPFCVEAQIKGEKKSSYIKINSLKEEQKALDEAYRLIETGDDQQAYKTSHLLLKKTNNISTKVYALVVLGVYANYHNIADSAIYYGNRVLKIIDNKQDSLSIARSSLTHNIIANAYADKNLLEESKKWHLKGIEIAEKHLGKKQYYTKLHNLAAIDIRLGNYANSIKLLESCLEYKDTPKFTYTVYISLSNAYASIDDFELSLSYLEKALSFFKNDNTSKEKTVIIQNIGALNHFLGNLEVALTYYNQALVIAKERNYHRPAIDAMTNIALIYQDKEMFLEAKKAYTEALLFSEKLGFLDKQITIYNNLRESSITQNDYQEAYKYYQKETKIKDSIRTLQKNTQINELEVKFKTLQKEKEIKVLHVGNENKKLALKNQNEVIKNLELKSEIAVKENENKVLSLESASEKRLNQITLLKKDQEIQQTKLARQKSIKNTILYSFLILLVLVVGLLIVYYQKLQAQSELNKKQKEISEQKISSIIKDQELKVIKASIKGQDKERTRIAQELHDSIGGNLAAIKLQLNNTQIHKNDYIKTINIQLDDTYEQVRNLSHNLIPKKFSVNNFCDVLEEYYTNIGQATRLKTSFIISRRTAINEIEENLQIEVFKIIQELITNIIKHAQATVVELQLNLNEDSLNILFEDNGIGFNTENNVDGIGFRNIKSRLKKISGVLHIDSRIKRGTIVNIDIPANV